MPVTEELLPSGHSMIQTCLLMFVHLEGSPFSHRAKLELCESNYWVLGHLPDLGPSTPVAQICHETIKVYILP